MRLLIGVVVASLVARPVEGQRRDSLSVAAGARVRVILYERPMVRIIGSYVESGYTRMLVADERTGIVVGADWDEIELIEAFEKRLTRVDAFGRGARVGAIVFGAMSAAALVTAIVYDVRGYCDAADDVCIPASLVVLVEGGLLTIGGTIVGGTVGLLFRDRWRTVWRPR